MDLNNTYADVITDLIVLKMNSEYSNLEIDLDAVIAAVEE